ncbi:hypothetical protein BDN71DRAFT_1505717 [Pleurotus eryngii]|uniref:Uncharacterized protein n=1 Tax=Pleurotus eryngii TaxID=5323 RepID=A0A9P6DGS3_PLEER|nr:hypothetical protein BDN71DRAFT_1505717 [Pleurotus eryngii]
MADFVCHDDVPTFQSHGSGKVILYTTLARTDTPHSATILRFPTLAPILKAISRKYAIVAKSMISMWNGESWEVVGPNSLALKEDGNVEWPDNFKLMLLLKPHSSLTDIFFTPSLGSSHSGGSLINYTLCLHLISYSAKPNLIPFAQLLEHSIIGVLHQMLQTASYNAYNAKVPYLPCLPAFPSVKDAHAVYVNTTSFSNYGKLFPFAIQHPAIHLYLQGDVPSGSTEYAALWGTLKPGLKTLGIVMKLTDEKEKEEKKVKRKAGPSKSNLQAYFMLLVVWFLLGLVPCVAVASKQDPFPNMLFTEFAQSVQSNFGPKIKLLTILMLLMTLVNNMDLLNLHGQQQASFRQESTSWMAGLVCAIKAKLSDNDFASLFNCHNTQAL